MGPRGEGLPWSSCLPGGTKPSFGYLHFPRTRDGQDGEGGWEPGENEVTCFTRSSAKPGAAALSHLQVRDCFSPLKERLKLTLCLIQTPAGAAAFTSHCSLPSRNPLQSEIIELKHSADRNNKHSAGSQQLCWASLFPCP